MIELGWWSLFFHFLRKHYKAWPTDRRTDTCSYRDARTHLIIVNTNIIFNRNCIFYIPITGKMLLAQFMLSAWENVDDGLKRCSGKDMECAVRIIQHFKKVDSRYTNIPTYHPYISIRDAQLPILLFRKQRTPKFTKSCEWKIIPMKLKKRN